MKRNLTQLLNTLPQVGRVEWIGLRTQRQAKMRVVEQAEAISEVGLVGDRYTGRSGKRGVTLVQHEHLAVVASILGLDLLPPELLRRNISISGMNLLALKKRTFTLGGAILEYTGLCHPCSRMEEALGPGAYNALRGHGGITARVLQSGKFELGSELQAVDSVSLARP
jgi:MOSC domain-containing protein YiiM